MTTLLAGKIYQQVRTKLLAGEYRPGSRLEYKSLSVELCASTTPVREAIGQLASEGLVELIPHIGAIVRVLEDDEAKQLYGVREAIETHAARKAAELISDASLQHLEILLAKMRQLISTVEYGESMKGMRLMDFLEADVAFHMTIIEASGNARLIKMAGDGHVHSRILGTGRFPHDRYLLDETDLVHRSIYNALKKRDATNASRLIADHINRSLELTLNHGAYNAQKAQHHIRRAVALAA